MNKKVINTWFETAANIIALNKALKQSFKRGYQKGYRAGKKYEHWKEIERKADKILGQTGLEKYPGAGGKVFMKGKTIKVGQTRIKKCISKK